MEASFRLFTNGGSYLSGEKVRQSTFCFTSENLIEHNPQSVLQPSNRQQCLINMGYKVLDLAGPAHGKAGPKPEPEPNQSLGLA